MRWWPRAAAEVETLEWNGVLPDWLTPAARQDLAFWLKHEAGTPFRVVFFRTLDSQCVGKIEVINGVCLASFGYWDGGTSVLAGMHAWMKSQGIKQITGPIDFSTFGCYRLRLNHFESAPLRNDPRNGPEHVKALVRNKYRLEHKYVTYEFADLDRVRDWAERQSIHRLQAHRLTPLKNISSADWDAHLEELHALTLKVFASNPAFAPISFSAFAAMYGSSILKAACGETSVLSYDDQDRVTGFCLNFVDPQNPQRLLVKSAGVHPEFRAQGLSFLSFIKHILETGTEYRQAAICQMRLGNVPSLILRGLATETREFGLFSKRL